MSRNQIVQITGFNAVGQRIELPVPAPDPCIVGTEHGWYQLAGAAACNRGIELADLGIIGIECGLVTGRRLAVRIEPGPGIGNREQRLLHRAVEQIAVAQFKPRCQGSAVVLHRCIRPPGAEQRLCGEGSVQPYSRKYRTRVDVAALLQIEVTEREIGLVAQVTQFGGIECTAAQLIELANRILRPIQPHQRHAQVVTRVGHPAFRAPPAVEQGNRRIKTTEREIRLRLEHWQFGIQACGKCTGDPVESLQRLRIQAALVAHLAKIEPRPVANLGFR